MAKGRMVLMSVDVAEDHTDKRTALTDAVKAQLAKANMRIRAGTYAVVLHKVVEGDAEAAE